MRRMRQFGWAAILLVIVGAGFIEARKFMPMAPADTAPPATNANAVLSQEESPSRDAPMAAAAPLAKADSTTADRPSPAAPRAIARNSAPAPRRESKPAPPPRAAAQGNADELPRSDAGKDSGALNEEAIDKVADSGPAKAEADSAAETDLASVRERASEALADLDRERRQKAAAAATAALDARKRNTRVAASTVAPATAQPAAALPPTPPTLEQRAQIYLRIGLDEASRQLGGPAHVIEGLGPLFMGLVPGGSVRGADGTRPVVRVVYQDSQGRLILLDQQRLRAGQSPPPASALSWTIGGTVMWLNGEAGAEILRTYRPRVR
jgi:hypothetical protein